MRIDAGCQRELGVGLIVEERSEGVSHLDVSRSVEDGSRDCNDSDRGQLERAPAYLHIKANKNKSIVQSEEVVAANEGD